jgi:endogenous inhibitor of DNA gyrase (YacG/DUF329 family)
MKKKLRDLEIGQKHIVNARRAAISSMFKKRSMDRIRRACSCCGKEFCVIRPKQRFCSSRCRLLYWAAGEIVKEYRAGNAQGLRKIIGNLGR